MDILNTINSFVWGPPLMVLLIGTGILLTVRLGLLQVIKLPTALKLIFTARNTGNGDINSFKALCTALAATVGTGNIVGVATAIKAGGPGALFWMWMAAFFGMATKYAEGVLAVKYRTVDANGNISSDALSGLEISYNLLNLPSKMYGWGDYSDYYRYLADGTKIQHEYSDGQQDEYRGSLVYYSNGEFSAPFGGGRLVSEGNTTEAHYFLTDHLGSTRVVAKVTPTGRIDLDRKDYYPFGKEWTQSSMPTSSNRYTFSGKERQDIESDDCITTPLYDFGARFYDPDGVHFLQQDPMAEKYYPISQYNYCLGNPIRLIDPNGMETTDALEEWIEELEKEIDDMRRRNNADIARYEAGRTDKNSKRTDRKIKKAEARNARLDQVTKEIAALRDSDQLYGITISNGNDGNGAFVYNEEAGTMDVLIPADSPLGLFAHELKHAYQFEKGELSAGPVHGGMGNFLYDFTDEKAAYERGKMFGHYVSDWKGRNSYKVLPRQSITAYSTKEFTPFSNEYTYQQAANVFNQAFRINNKTYLPKKK